MGYRATNTALYHILKRGEVGLEILFWENSKSGPKFSTNRYFPITPAQLTYSSSHFQRYEKLLAHTLTSENRMIKVS